MGLLTLGEKKMNWTEIQDKIAEGFIPARRQAWPEEQESIMRERNAIYDQDPTPYYGTPWGMYEPTDEDKAATDWVLADE